MSTLDKVIKHGVPVANAVIFFFAFTYLGWFFTEQSVKVIKLLPSLFRESLPVYSI